MKKLPWNLGPMHDDDPDQNPNTDDPATGGGPDPKSQGDRPGRDQKIPDDG